ncbi:MAG: hypothetical protein PGN23_00030 [Sphingomonas adhaesiva]|uniref:hypothetical protein n=1 Tax=Sphingomonas adhaesiva TaxID=28212 RepID=UPI002FF9CAD0
MINNPYSEGVAARASQRMRVEDCPYTTELMQQERADWLRGFGSIDHPGASSAFPRRPEQ